MKPIIIRGLLSILNSSWLNCTPCRYQFVGNLDAWSRENLESECLSDPTVTVRQILNSADQFKACILRSGLTVIEGETVRDATIWDIHDFRNLREQAAPAGGEVVSEPITKDGRRKAQQFVTTTEAVDKYEALCQQLEAERDRLRKALEKSRARCIEMGCINYGWTDCLEQNYPNPCVCCKSKVEIDAALTAHEETE